MDAKLKKEGWIENNGKQPFNDGTIVDVMFKDRTIALNRYCGGPNHYRCKAGLPFGNSMWAPNTYKLTDQGSSVKYYRVPWKRHRGGKCPVKVGQTGEFRMRNGQTFVTKIADNIAEDRSLWSHTPKHKITHNTDIMAYRVIRGIDC